MLKCIRNETFAAFKKLNIAKAVVSGNPESVEEWADKDKDNRVIRGILMFSPDDYGMDVVKFEQMVKTGQIEIFGELGPYYRGTTLSDPIWQPYLKICEEYDIPVAVHTGGGDPGGTYSWAPKARLSLGIKHAGYLDRVMFGSDQMIWPYSIKKSVDFLNSLDFLSDQDKQGILYGNAAKFLKLEEKVMRSE